jgi:nucleoside-diphosphate-sugar epimerase
MKIAIIGGSSFIGQNLLQNLLKKKVEIISTFTSNSKIKYEFPKVKWKKLDIKKNKKNYYKFLGSPDILINLSWPDIPNYNSKNHFKTYLYQKRFNYNLINNGLKNLIVMGTCYEYGKRTGKISENTFTKPLIPYAVSKLKLLNSIMNLKKKKKFKFTWLRPFFVFGKNKKRKTLFTIINGGHKDELSKLKLPGKLIRDFVPVNFLSRVIIKIIKLNNGFEILNVTSGKGVSIKNFIKKNLKNKKNIKLINMNGKNPNKFEPNSFWGDNSKLKKIISK